MSEQSWFNAVAVVLIVVVLVGFLAGFGLSNNESTSASSSGGSSSGPAPFNVTMVESANPNNGHDEFFPANITVPSGVPVNITFYCYDQGVNNATLLPAGTSHTWTIPSLGIKVYLPAANAADNNTPTKTFLTYTFSPGVYQWNCMAPCDPWSMLQAGYMIGTVTAQ